MTTSAPLLLALDTSTSTASVALFDGQRVLSETTWLAGREHSTRLLIEVEVALDRVGCTPGDLTGLVVARGPGSFTGVRVALSVAKGIATGLSIPVWGVSSLDALAAAAGVVEVPVRTIVEAGRGRYAVALYVDGQCVEAPVLATVEQLQALIVEPTLLIGELSDDARQKMAQQPYVRLASSAASLRRAGFVAELGWGMSQSGDPGDARSL
ncbi:MAG TPA: tRNA (adenosine(37)-N6)-threonylcarbamoyltransferase complex dimerization subunit type 1 TsaB, partial [Chloroflexota bacterium]|nr:tRNA (adenosine(37)-N6)-threonylcarbamoyltransferase complex dimerization subunit type 1 TsaB [Chloroflexota bacterium]